MIKIFSNFFYLYCVVRERGNWKLIRHSRKQLMDFILCRSGMNRMSVFYILPYWFNLLRGPEVLIWRLETFGFLFSIDIDEKIKDHLNSYL